MANESISSTPQPLIDSKFLQKYFYMFILFRCMKIRIMK